MCYGGDDLRRRAGWMPLAVRLRQTPLVPPVPTRHADRWPAPKHRPYLLQRFDITLGSRSRDVDQDRSLDSARETVRQRVAGSQLASSKGFEILLYFEVPQNMQGQLSALEELDRKLDTFVFEFCL